MQRAEEEEDADNANDSFREEKIQSYLDIIQALQDHSVSSQKIFEDDFEADPVSDRAVDLPVKLDLLQSTTFVE